MTETAQQFYCLGTGTMDKCKSCIHEKNWNDLNELPEQQRLEQQALMQSIPIDQCRLTKAMYYIPIEKTVH